MAQANTPSRLPTVQALALNVGAVLKTPLIHAHGPNYTAYHNWLAANALSKPSNVQIIPNAGVNFNQLNFGLRGGPACKAMGGYMAGATPAPTPTGLKSQYGVRATMLYHALNAPINLHTWLNACANCGNKPSGWANPHKFGIPTGGQVYSKPIVLLAMLNGGFTPKSPQWGHSLISLKVVGQTVPAKTKSPAKK
tara:strand:+ start:449 stop:1033 length:585 start_codon:yes stop_codon:yes gene_type:complete